MVGGDTILRIADPKYGILRDTMDAFAKFDTQFIVFDRQNCFLENQLPNWLLKITKIVPGNEYQDDGTSSTKIRNLALQQE